MIWKGKQVLLNNYNLFMSEIKNLIYLTTT